VAAPLQFRDYIARQPLIQQQTSRAHGVVVEARYQMLTLEPRRFHRPLRILPEQYVVEEHLDQRLILVIAARRGERDQIPIRSLHQGRAQRHPRPLSGRQFIRMAGDQ